MRATGIVRRVDDLGRIVIPMEIRRTTGIREGDPLEIYVDKKTKSIIFQRYSKHNEVAEQIDDIMQENDTLPKEVITLLSTTIEILRSNNNEED